MKRQADSDSDGGGGGLFAEDELPAGWCEGVFSFDAMELDEAAGHATFLFSHRDSCSGTALARFQTALHLPQPCPLWPAGAAAAALAVGLASLPWLWLGVPCRRIAVRAALLTPEQCSFWAATYNGCCAEFFALNGFALPDGAGVSVECDTSARPLSPRQGAARVGLPPGSTPLEHRVLVPLGGGKDSLTTWELLRPLPVAKRWLYVEDDAGEFAANWRLAALVVASGAPDPALVATHCWRDAGWEAYRRRRYRLVGHPWAALVACTAALVALVHSYDAIAVGNERSAGEGNGCYQGVAVNHQHDKSLAFERPCAAYFRAHLHPGLAYFSCLAHLWEVQVAQRFCAPAVARRYLRLFTSCNEAATSSHPSRACAACAKCLFVSLLLTAFLEHPAEAICYAGDDLLQGMALAPLLAALLDPDQSNKPLDCVGSARESALCVARAAASYRRHGLAVPALLVGALDAGVAATAAEAESMLVASDGPHGIPDWAADACGADERFRVP